MDSLFRIEVTAAIWGSCTKARTKAELIVSSVFRFSRK